MKTTSLSKLALFATVLVLAAISIAQAQLPFRPLFDAPANTAEEQQLSSIFALGRAASASVQPGPDAGFQRRQIGIELNNELESFVGTTPNSAWTPGVRLWLARRAKLRSAYVQAFQHHAEVWEAARGRSGIPARKMAGEALGGLALALARSARLAELDGLEVEARQLGVHPVGSEWGRAMELRASARKRPTKTYECGLYCLDQLGRLTQPGQFQSKAITDTPSSLDGLTAADLVQIGAGAGLRVHAAWLSSSGELPVPSIVLTTSS